ncbi:type I restriction endonuclease subunit R [Neorhodopirellula lusitana]|uniref:type I restriction endonuclease subunit R n=1 Tax=Neorhodopirellula lusitana TaxID=445327 RepID=UPI00384C74C4
MTPEQLARQNIDRNLSAAGWVVQNHAEMNISAGRGVAVREFPLKTGAADYALYVDEKVIGVVEAKPERHTLTGVETQSAKYTHGLDPSIPHYAMPLPFAYESTGKVTRFTNNIDPAPRSRQVFNFHRPEELRRLVDLGADGQLRARLQAMPELAEGKLWPVQIRAISNLEASLAQDRPRALIQMTMGSGKTFTSISFIYRLIKFAGAKRVLFLVDRNNLGEQTENEYQLYTSPYNNLKFTEEYGVQRLTGNTISSSAKVVITTIQRLYSMLQGEKDFDVDREEESAFESSSPLVKEALPVVYNADIPIETFDFIVVDECHRSIYNQWRQVLDYFDAFTIGLTATPTKQTLGFFNGNLVEQYGHEAAVADNVNVGFDVYSIRTQITADGAKLDKEPGFFVPHRDRRTRATVYKELDEEITYSGEQLDRIVVSKAQIRLVIQTFRDRLFTEIFPHREHVPKTLVFAKNDNHAEDIVKIIREEFGKGNDFCQKITSKTTGKKPKELLAEFRNSYNPRIAVTVDMIATGTDVKPLECLLFMRNINSWAYFEQMKGRGSRVIDTARLRSVTPDARHKTRFVIVDAVGVCDRDKSVSKPLERKPSVSMKQILDEVKKGVVHPDITSTLAARLTRIAARHNEAWHEEFYRLTDQQSIGEIAKTLIDSTNPDEVVASALVKTDDGNIITGNTSDPALGLSAERSELDEATLKRIEEERMRQALKPFHDPKLRELLLRINEQIIDESTPDTLVHAGYDLASQERAQSLISDFQQFIEDNKDEIEAISILYSRPYAAGLRYSQIKDLARRLSIKPFHVDESQPQTLLKLWQAFGAVHPDKVDTNGKHCKHIVDLVALVRHAIDPDSPLRPVGMTVDERFTEWLSDQQSSGGEFTDEQMQWLVAIKDHIASSLMIEQDDFEYAPFNQFGGIGRAYELFGDRLAEIMEELNARLAA